LERITTGTAELTDLTDILHGDRGLSQTASRVLVVIATGVLPVEPKIYHCDILCQYCAVQLVKSYDYIIIILPLGKWTADVEVDVK